MIKHEINIAGCTYGRSVEPFRIAGLEAMVLANNDGPSSYNHFI